MKREFAGTTLRTVRKALGSDEKMSAACAAVDLHAKVRGWCGWALICGPA